MKELILNEQELIKRCLNKDRHAQEFLFNQFYDNLYRIALRYLSDHHNAEDAVVTAFTKVYKNLSKFKFNGQGSLGRWVRTILINESIRILKKQRLLQFEADMHLIDREQSEPTGLQQLEASDIIRLIEQLPAGYRTVFNLFIVEGYSHKEIADMLGISENTSKTQLKKARGQLITKIEEERSYGTV